MTAHPRLMGALLAGASALAFSSVASAQASDVVEEVVVTGSRTIQTGNDMPTPVTVVSTEQLQIATPRGVIDGLSALPTITSTGPRTRAEGGRTISLRGVGTLRTLVLFDGRRVPPTAQGGEVNVDLVPSMLLQRVDVVTGGASAVYGSDAVAGVVNFITDRNFNGYKIEGQYGVSKYGDGKDVKLGFAAGMDVLAGRGHIVGSYEYQDIEEVRQIERDWDNDVWAISGLGTAANPYVRTKNFRNSNLSYFGTIPNAARNGPLRDMSFRENGVLSPFRHGTPTGSSGFESGGDGEWAPFYSLQSASETHKAFGRFDYDLTENVHAYAQVAALWAHNRSGAGNIRFNNVVFSANNAYLRPEYRAALLAANVTTFTFGKWLLPTGGVRPEDRITGLLAMAGLEGRLGDAWNWEVGFTRGRNTQANFRNQNIDRGRAFAAMDAVVNPANGQIVCNVTLTHPTAYPGCVPINMFGPTSESPEALAYIMARTGFEAETTQNQVGGSIAGSPFSLPAGPVQIALSAEWRELKFVSDSNHRPNDPIDCNGIRFNNCTPSIARYQTTTFSDAAASQCSTSITTGGWTSTLSIPTPLKPRSPKSRLRKPHSTAIWATGSLKMWRSKQALTFLAGRWVSAWRIMTTTATMICLSPASGRIDFIVIWEMESLKM